MEEFRQISIINEHNFELIFKDLYPVLCRYCMQFIRKPEIAEEIVQELFLYLWEKRKVIKITSSLRSYLYKSVKNKSLDYLKSKFVKLDFNGENKLLDFKENTDPVKEYEKNELENLVEEALKILPEKCYTIFSMSRYGNFSNKEIAKQLNISVKTVENQITIALKKIKNFIEFY